MPGVQTDLHFDLGLQRPEHREPGAVPRWQVYVSRNEGYDMLVDRQVLTIPQALVIVQAFEAAVEDAVGLKGPSLEAAFRATNAELQRQLHDRLVNARQVAASIPELENRLKELGG